MQNQVQLASFHQELKSDIHRLLLSEDGDQIRRLLHTLNLLTSKNNSAQSFNNDRQPAQSSEEPHSIEDQSEAKLKIVESIELKPCENIARRMFWHAANIGVEQVIKVLAKYKSEFDFATPVIDGTKALTMVIARGRYNLMPYFYEIYGKDSVQIVKECVKLGKVNMISSDQIIKLDETTLHTLMKDAIMSDRIESFEYVKNLFEINQLDYKVLNELVEQRHALGIRAAAGLSTETEASALVEMSRYYPVFNDQVEKKFVAGLQLENDHVILSADCQKVLKKCCCLVNTDGSSTQEVSKMELPNCASSCEQKTDCKLVRDLLWLCQELEKELQKEISPASDLYDSIIHFLRPQFFVIGSVAEGTRVGKATEIDVTMKFARLDFFPFRTGKDATELLLPQDSEAREHLKEFVQNGTSDVFDFSKFLKFILTTVESCLKKIDLNNNTCLEVAMWNEEFEPCNKCNARSRNSKSVHQAVKHCEDCLPVLTHTRIGPCLVFRQKNPSSSNASATVATIDLVPVFPVDEENILNLVILVTKTLVENRPPFWLDYFNTILKSEGIFLEYCFKDRQSAEMEGKKKLLYVALKLLHYGPNQNYIIKPGQRMPIEEFHSNEMLKKIYIYTKAIKDLLEIDVKSCMLKRAVLLPEFTLKVQNEKCGLPHEKDLKFNQFLLKALSCPHIKNSFEKRINFDEWNRYLEDWGNDSLKDSLRGTIPLQPFSGSTADKALKYYCTAASLDLHEAGQE